MRLKLAFAAMPLFVLSGLADTPPTPAPAANAVPTDAVIMGLCGDTLANMFAKCGVPTTIFVNGDKQAILSYGSFGFCVKNQTVTASYFFESWPGTFKGVKRGDTKDQAVKVLGAMYDDVKGKNFEAFGWKLPDQKSTFWLYWKDGKVDYPQITLND